MVLVEHVVLAEFGIGTDFALMQDNTPSASFMMEFIQEYQTQIID